MYNNIPLGLRKRLLAGSTFALLSLSAAPALATDWWMIFGTGDTPNRDLFFADAQSVKATQQHPQNTQLTVVQGIRKPQQPQLRELRAGAAMPGATAQGELCHRLPARRGDHGAAGA